jgi:TP901 family phage tail tape measure protein
VASPITVDIEGRYKDAEIQRAMRDLKKLQTAGLTTGAKLQGFGSQMQAMGQSVARVGKGLTVGVTLPIVGVGVAATKMAMDFDTSLTKMVSLVGLTRGEVDGMRGDIIDMASQYGKSAKEAADAMFFITSAGLRGSDAMDTLEASLKGAAVGLGDVQTIADLATSAMNAYGPANLSASNATDILANAVREGKLESSELAGAMGQVLPIASAMGVGFDEVGAAMAAMSRTGTNASQASTQLRSIMTSILKPTVKAEKAMQDMGLSSEGLRKQIREEGLLSVLQTLSDEFDGNDAAAAAVFGNVRALSGVMDLMGENADTTAQIFGNLTESTGILDEAMGVAADTTGFKLQKAFATMKNSLIEFGDIIAPFVEQVAGRITELGQAFNNLSPQTKQFIVQGLAIAAAIGPVVLIVGKLIMIIGGVIKVVGLLVAAFNPVTLVIAAVVGVIALVVAAFKLAYDRSEPLRKAVQDLVTTLRNLFNMVRDSVLGAFTSMNKTLGESNGFFSKLGQYLGAAFTRIVQTLTNIVKVLGAAFQVAVKVFEVGFTIMRMGASIIRGVLIAAFDILMNKLGPISAALRGIANGVRSAFTMVAGIVSSAFSNVGKAVETFINFGIKAVNALIDAYNKLVGFLPGVTRATRIAEFRFQSLSAATNESTAATFNAMSATGANIRETERNSYQNSVLAGILADKLAPGYDTVGDAASGAAKGSKAAGNAATESSGKLEKFKAKFDEVAGALKKAREDIERDYTGMVTTVTNAIMGALDFNAALPEVDENGERVGKTFIEKLQEQAEQATGFAARIRTLIAEGLSLEAIQMVVAAGVTAGTKIADELIAGGATAIDETNRLIESTQLAANAIGVDAADHFFGAGLALAKQTEDAFTKRFGEGGPGYNKLNRLMNHLARSLDRTSTITVVTRHVTEGVPGRRMGGPVAAGSPYIVGEAGPELFVPTMTGRILPNHDISGSMTGRGSSTSLGGKQSTINLTVNAGIGTDGAEVGRQIVDAIKSYERRNGSVYVAA